MGTPVRLPWCSDRRNREPAAPHPKTAATRSPRSSMEAITTTSCVQVGREDVHAPACVAATTRR
jgi:hypothetical protein